MSQKKWRRGGVRERGRKNIFSSSHPPHEKRVPLKAPAWEVTYSLPLTLFQALPRLFSSVLHFAPLSTIHTVHYALNRLVHSAWARQFFPMPMQGIYRCPFRSSCHFISSYSRCNYSCFSISKTHFFSTFCCADGALFCWWCFIVDRDELKYFLKRFLQSAFISVIVIHSERYMYTYRIAGFQCHAIQNRSK